jgi:hypothetical protein
VLATNIVASEELHYVQPPSGRRNRPTKIGLPSDSGLSYEVVAREVAFLNETVRAGSGGKNAKSTQNNTTTHIRNTGLGRQRTLRLGASDIR